MVQSSTTTSSSNLASQWPDIKLLEVLKELVNVRDDAGASRFLQLFPNFLNIQDRGWLVALVESVPRFTEKQPASGTAARANARTYPVKRLSELVREIWRGLPEGAANLLVFLVIDDVTDALQVAIASRQAPLPDDRTKHILEKLEAVPARLLQTRLRLDWTRQGRFAYQAATPFQKALLLLWSKSSLAKVCKNPDCPAPFFIARRVQQQYCGDECAAPFRLEAKMNWWNKVGKERREKISKRQKKGKKA